MVPTGGPERRTTSPPMRLPVLGEAGYITGQLIGVNGGMYICFRLTEDVRQRVPLAGTTR